MKRVYIESYEEYQQLTSELGAWLERQTTSGSVVIEKGPDNNREYVATIHADNVEVLNFGEVYYFGELVRESHHNSTDHSWKSPR